MSAAWRDGMNWDEYPAFDVGDIDRSLIGDGSHSVRFRGEITRARYAVAKIIDQVITTDQCSKSQAARLRYIRSCLESGNVPSKKSVRAATVPMRAVYAIAEREAEHD